jgi:hypothetical protein
MHMTSSIRTAALLRPCARVPKHVPRAAKKQRAIRIERAAAFL